MNPCSVCGRLYCTAHPKNKQASVTKYSRKVANAVARSLRGKEKTCSRCSKVGLTHQIDHRIPLDEGGLDVEWNLQILCKECHDKKTGEQKARKYRNR